MLNNLIHLTLLVLLSNLWLSNASRTPMEKDIELKTNKMLEKSCCEKDFIMLILAKWDDCMKMNTWEFKEEPYVVCRRDLFKMEGPCNEERKAKCKARKDEWLKCIDKVTGSKDDLKLKKEFQNNDEKIKEFPKQKLLCFQRALADIKCK